MFNKTKRKIVFTVVFSLLALMIVTLTTIYLSNRLSIERESRQMLQTFAERYSLEMQQGRGTEEERPEGVPEFDSGNKPDMRQDRRGKDEPAFRLSTFYSVAY